MAKEDILRLILVITLVEDIFESGIRTWFNLMAALSSKNGRIIPIKESSL